MACQACAHRSAVCSGLSADIMARLLAAGLHRRLGQPMIAENKPGVGGALGPDQVAKAAPDGYTLSGFHCPELQAVHHLAPLWRTADGTWHGWSCLHSPPP
ncbi:tripartite tricarboxylate transporter substrate-binding protein [Comamonas testosteroni]|uniref:tripartite tricarboxylate transporter substrate-binding protein n=1 Tax=Comamonas testosteroni TaxID=285 RepID=UPI002E78388C|nr:tripartite tricarboxylate transporter substrate-binding protein [Comamonas testosteroni]